MRPSKFKRELDHLLARYNESGKELKRKQASIKSCFVSRTPDTSNQWNSELIHHNFTLCCLTVQINITFGFKKFLYFHYNKFRHKFRVVFS
jgi:hypothetical protein